MKPAREPVSSRRKPCASLKKPHESCPFAAPCGPRRKKNDRGQRSAFPSETPRFVLSILAHRASALPWLVNDRAALRLRRHFRKFGLESTNQPFTQNDAICSDRHCWLTNWYIEYSTSFAATFGQNLFVLQVTRNRMRSFQIDTG